MTTEALVETENPPMRCMEIHGGSGPASEHFSRPGLDLWLTSQSHSPVPDGGSDLYLLSSCASGRITRLMLADVCSPGAEFASPAADLRDVMKTNINTVRQTRCVGQVNEHLHSWSETGSFATIVMATYFAPLKSLALCNAGHALPLLYRAKPGTWSALKQATEPPPGEALCPGVVERDEYQELSARLDYGDIFVIYSSSLTECLDEHGHTLGTEGVLSRVRGLAPEEPASLGEALINDIRLEHYGNLKEEDATVLIGKVTAGGVPWRDNLLALFRYFTKPLDRTRYRTPGPS